MLTSFLISLVGKRLGVVLGRFLPYLIGVLAVALVGWLIWSNGYDDGVADTEQKYQTAIQEERHRQLEANQAALDAVNQRLRELERLLDERDATISELNDEAAQDPDADRRAIGTGSVQRLNRIR